MIDESDGDFALLASGGVGGFLGIVALLAALVFYYVACQNSEECAKKHCDSGKPVLTHHECVCEVPAI